MLLLSLMSMGMGVDPACGAPVDGQVLDHATGKPIAGAIVVGRWLTNIPAVVQSFSVCVHVELANTDDNGRYHLAASSEPFDATLDAYKPGYESTPSPLRFVGRPDGTWVVFRRPKEILQVFKDKESARAATHPENVYMKPFTGSPSDRFEYLGYRVFSGMNCLDAGENRRNLYPLFRAAYQEAKTVATSKEQQRALTRMRDSAKRVWSDLPRNSTAPNDPLVPEQVERDLE